MITSGAEPDAKGRSLPEGLDHLDFTVADLETVSLVASVRTGGGKVELR